MQEKNRKQIPLDNCTWTRVPSICTGSDALEKKWKMSLCLFPQTFLLLVVFFSALTLSLPFHNILLKFTKIKLHVPCKELFLKKKKNTIFGDSI